MHTRTIAAALMSSLEEVMDGPEDVPHIVSEHFKESADIMHVSGVFNEGSFLLNMSDGSRFRVDVVAI